MKNLDFSIIIPAYNNLELFKRALGSVIKQKRVSFEIIVVDDSSNDDIEDYVSYIRLSSIRYYHNHPAKGAVANWNFGLSQAKGRYVEVLHHDEALANNDILWAIKQQFERTHCAAVIAHYQVLINGIAKHELAVKRLLSSSFIKHPVLLFLANLLGPCACVFIENRDIAHFDEHLRWFVDVDWYYRTLKEKKITILYRPFFISSIHGHQGQITESIDIQAEAERDACLIAEKYHSLFINILLLANKLLQRIKCSSRASCRP